MLGILELSDTQKEQLLGENAFEVEVNDRLYRIRPGRKVERLNYVTKEAELLFCIAPVGLLTEEDICDQPEIAARNKRRRVFAARKQMGSLGEKRLRDIRETACQIS